MGAALALVPLRVVERVEPANSRRLALVGANDRAMQSPTVGDVLDRWLSRCDLLLLDSEGAPLSRSTRNGYSYSIADLEPLRSIPAEQLRPDVVQAAVSSLCTKVGNRGGPYAARRARDTLRAAYRHAHVQMAVLPTEGVRVPRKIQRRDTHVPASTMRAIDSAAGDLALEGVITDAAADVIRFGVRQGLRLRDILCLRAENLHADERWVLAWIHKGKRWARIPLSTDSLEILEARASLAVDGWLFPGRRHRGKLTHISNVRRAWSLVLDRVAEMPVDASQPDGPRNVVIDHRGKRLVFHHLRHGFVAAALDAGIAPINIARAIGQTDWQSVGAYASASIDGAREAVDTISQLVQGQHMAPPPKGTVGSRLSEAMAAKGYSAEDLAAALTKADKSSPIGIRSIYDYKADVRDIPSSRIPVLCRLLGVSADWLLGVSRG